MREIKYDKINNFKSLEILLDYIKSLTYLFNFIRKFLEVNTVSARMIYEESSITDNQGLVSKIIRVFICEFQIQNFYFFSNKVLFHWKTVKSENS